MTVYHGQLTTSKNDAIKEGYEKKIPHDEHDSDARHVLLDGRWREFFVLRLTGAKMWISDVSF